MLLLVGAIPAKLPLFQKSISIIGHRKYTIEDAMSSIIMLVPMFVGVVGGVIGYRIFVKSLQFIAAMQKNAIARTRQEQLDARNRSTNQAALKYNGSDSSDEYTSLRG